MRTLNKTFDELKLALAPDMTFIGRIARGFDLLGYYLSRAVLALAPIRNTVASALRANRGTLGCPALDGAPGTGALLRVGCRGGSSSVAWRGVAWRGVDGIMRYRFRLRHRTPRGLPSQRLQRPLWRVQLGK